MKRLYRHVDVYLTAEERNSPAVQLLLDKAEDVLSRTSAEAKNAQMRHDALEEKLVNMKEKLDMQSEIHDCKIASMKKDLARRKAALSFATGVNSLRAYVEGALLNFCDDHLLKPSDSVNCRKFNDYLKITKVRPTIHVEFQLKCFCF